MSIEALSVVLNHSQAKGAAKLVLLGIANHLGPDAEEGAWPSQARLARYANVSDRAVRTAINELSALGELRVEQAAGVSRSQYRPNRYWITLRCPEDCDRSLSHNRVEETSVRVEVFDGRAEETYRQGGSFLPSGWKQASYEPSLNLKKKQQEPIAQPKASLFEDFWKVYPRKAGKQSAAKAYEKALKLATPEAILEGARRYAEDPNRSEAYTAHAATWLNGGRWEDEPLPERQLTLEEKQERERIKRENQRAAEIEASRLAREEAERERERIRLNPPKRCEHDRIIFACRICAPKVIDELQH